VIEALLEAGREFVFKVVIFSTAPKDLKFRRLTQAPYKATSQFWV